MEDRCTQTIVLCKSRWRKRASKSIGPLDKDFAAALQAFSAEAGNYCNGISDHTAHTYAVTFTIVLENRAKEIEIEEPRSRGLFEPNRNLIRSTLKSLYGRFFARLVAEK
jgi:hypothetical protein